MSARILGSMALLVPLLMAAAPRPHLLPVRATVQLQRDTISEEDQDQLMAISQSLLNAVATGDTATWSRYLLADCIMTDADGVTHTKAQLLKMMHPLPPEYSGTLRMQRPLISVYGTTAVIAYGALQNEVVYGQKLITRYQMMDTYVKTPSGWQMISSQSFVIPQELIPIAVDSATLNMYVGRYALAPTVVYDVIREGDRLFGQWPGGSKEELVPTGAATFFRHGVRGIRLFERDATGRVTRMIDRRDGSDLIWTRVQQ